MELENNGLYQDLKIERFRPPEFESGVNYVNHITVCSKTPIHSLAANMFHASRLDEIEAFLKHRKYKKRLTSRYEKIKNYFYSNLEFIGKETEKSKHQEAEFSMALRDMDQFKAISRNYIQLKEIPLNLFRAFFKDDLLPKTEISPGRDFLFEYYIGARFKAAGCKVIQQEPDFVCEFEGERFGVAVKRLRIKSLRDHISKAGEQLKKQGLLGVVAIDLSQNIFEKKLFKGSQEDCRAIVHKWMHDNFSAEIQKRKDWNIYKKNIRGIVAFILVGYYNTELKIPCNFSHFTYVKITRPPGECWGEKIESDDKTALSITNAIHNMQITNPSID